MKPFPCHLYMLYINEKGEVYPCPRAKQDNLIGLVTEYNILEKVLYYQPVRCSCSICEIRPANIRESQRGIINTNLEIGGECNGACVYCFQKTLSTFRKPFLYYKELYRFYEQLNNLKYTTIFGGEVTVQKRTMKFISELRDKHHNVVNLVTNGMIPPERYDTVCRNFDSFQVTFNGFSKTSMYYIAKLDYHVTKSFCEYVSNKADKILDVKFLLSPLVINDLIEFLEWSLTLNVSHIMVYYAIIPSDNYEQTGNREVSSLECLEPRYWDEIISRVSCDFENFFLKNINEIKRRNINFIINKDVLDFLKLPVDFIENNGIPSEKTISITCKAWAKYIDSYDPEV